MIVLAIIFGLFSLWSLVWVLGFYWRNEKKPWEYPD